MDFIAALIPHLGFSSLLPFAVLALVLPFKTPWGKGLLGEFQVNLLARLLLPKDDYHLIKNVTLPTKDGGTTQIDHVIISQHGVFVIETKNMKGWIYGKANQKTWTQKIYRHSNQFQNPLHQNYKHTKTLEELLGIPETAIHSIVVFVGACKFKTSLPENVTYAGGYMRHIKTKQENLLSREQVEEIISAIEGNRLRRGFSTNRAHIKHVKENLLPGKTRDRQPSQTFSRSSGANVLPNKTRDKSAQKVCPRCGGGIVLREAKKGRNIGKKFWGCEKFPRCRGKITIG